MNFTPLYNTRHMLDHKSKCVDHEAKEVEGFVCMLLKNGSNVMSRVRIENKTILKMKAYCVRLELSTRFKFP